MNDNTELERQLYRNGLYSTLIVEGNSAKQSATLCDEFDKLKMSPAGAVGIIYAAYGSQNPRMACQRIKQVVEAKLQESNASVVSDWIAGQLAKIGSAPKPETDSVKRFKQLVTRLNKMIQDGGSAVTVDGKGLSQFEIEQAKIKVAPCLQEQIFSYTSTASHTVNGKTYTEFGLDTIGEKSK